MFDFLRPKPSALPPFTSSTLPSTLESRVGSPRTPRKGKRGGKGRVLDQRILLGGLHLESS